VRVRHLPVTVVGKDLGTEEVPPMLRLPDPSPAPAVAPVQDDDFQEPVITIEMGGQNIVLRASAHADRAYTATIAEAINAASDADTTVVVDPAPIRCDDLFAAYHEGVVEPACAIHDRCRPVAAEVMRAGVVRLRTERDSWMLDVNGGRLCRLGRHTDVRFIGDEAWERVVAVCITRSRLVARLPDGRLLSARRAHAAAA
jgi:hypothetical protein